MDFSSCEDDDTPQHKAVREALANAPKHAGYYDRCGIVAIRYADRVEIRNPGGLRVWVWDDPAAGPPAERLQAHANARLTEVGLQTVAAVIGERELPDLLDKRNKGTLILPGEHSALLSRWVGPTILVP